MDMIPTQIAHDSDILPNHVSKVLRELKEKDVVVCTNEQDRKNRNYHLVWSTPVYSLRNYQNEMNGCPRSVLYSDENYRRHEQVLVLVVFFRGL